MTKDTATQHKNQIMEELSYLGVSAGETLLVHTSLKGLHTDGLSPNEIIEALLALLTPEGTLLVPALSYANVSPETGMRFDTDSTPSCIGALPECFRLHYATRRSVHPTHSVCAVGRLAESVTADHLLDETPVGIHSPFMKLPLLGGKILMLGCGLRPNTFMHGVEEAAGASYPLGKKKVEYQIVNEGASVQKKYYPHEFNGLVQRYDRIAEFLSPAELTKGKVLGGEACLLDAAAVLHAGIRKIRECDGYFVDEPISATNR